MTKKHINNAELDFILLDAQDIVTASDFSINDEVGVGQCAPDRGFFGGSDFNYRGVEKGYEDEEW